MEGLRKGKENGKHTVTRKWGQYRAGEDSDIAAYSQNLLFGEYSVSVDDENWEWSGKYRIMLVPQFIRNSLHEGPTMWNVEVTAVKTVLC